MSYSTGNSDTFFSPSGELIPAEAKAGILREGRNFFRKSNATGATVDRDGLSNIHASVPRAVQGADDTPRQKVNLTVVYAIATWGLIGAAVAATYFAG